MCVCVLYITDSYICIVTGSNVCACACLYHILVMGVLYISDRNYMYVCVCVYIIY